ncbi:hypothetical protein ANCCEY_06549 [Ancylostoma ceylanicum]|uniref:Nucleotide-diphospho-sugar transferase domain-containing protein n=1 Tax=Ancylostoma ceylanicum TaxID=53326 RepID=A0A0D6LQR1_9BILA|nr:hypothetical protein ANCCEY_06549 [Ancylostoma ceylanicum]
MIAVAILLFLFLIRRLHGGHENWSYIHISRPPEPVGEALNDLPPITFAELEHFLPDSVENKIAILDVIEADTPTVFYQHAMMSVACYARAQGYEFRIVFSSNYSQECPHKDVTYHIFRVTAITDDFAVYLRRHCVVAQVLPQYHTILYIDADMGVVNPKRRIEEYIDEGVEISFFDRFYNWEVAAGSYIVKNTKWTQKFLKDFADYEFRLPKYYHGTDNGALHAFLGEVLFGEERKSELAFCLHIYYNLKSYDDLFTFEACIRHMLGMHGRMGKIRIYKKGTAWVRDNWMTNTKWSPDRDFMMHNWKITQLRRYTERDLPLINTTWSYDPNLIESSKKIEAKLQGLYDVIERDRIKSLARMIT